MIIRPAKELDVFQTAHEIRKDARFDDQEPDLLSPNLFLELPIFDL
jgi:hypothetical protein